MDVMGIREEFIVFVLAVLSGCIIRLFYRFLSCIRLVIKHTNIMVESENLIYWVGIAIYLFVQIYYTSDGSIRWYFALGVVLGAILSSILIKKVEKLHKKIYMQRGKDFF